MIECTRDNSIFIDSAIKNVEYVNSFGFEWTKIDGFVGKETMSHGHLFGRFLLPSDYLMERMYSILVAEMEGLEDS